MSHPPDSSRPSNAGEPFDYPQYTIVKYRRQTNHQLHALLTVGSCFMWLPVWVLITVWNKWGPESTGYIEHR